MRFGLFGSETRSSDAEVSISNTPAVVELFSPGGKSSSGVSVSEEAALGITAVWQAVQAISGTIAHLPLHLYTKDKSGEVAKKTKDPLYRIVHDQANDVLTQVQWRKWLASRLVLEGRAICVILYDKINRVQGFLPLELSTVQVEQKIVNGRPQRFYRTTYTTYEAWQVLDFVLMPKADGVSHYNPIQMHRNALGLMIAAERYGASLFLNGGVPPLVLKGPQMSPGAASRANNDIMDTLQGNSDRRRNILTIPTGFDIKDVGLDPSKQQLVELRKWMVSEASRIFNIAPALLHDLTTGTYSNVEQQNLSFAQHTISPLVELIEQEMNSKLFGERNKSDYIEFNLDGLQRGDFLSRMDGMSKAVVAGIRTPNEIRALDNLPPKPGGDQLLVQGAMVPLQKLGETPAPEPSGEPSETAPADVQAK